MKNAISEAAIKAANRTTTQRCRNFVDAIQMVACRYSLPDDRVLIRAVAQELHRYADEASAYDPDEPARVTVRMQMEEKQ